MARHEPATIAAVVFASTALVGMVIGGVGPLLVPSSSAATTSGDIPHGGQLLRAAVLKYGSVKNAVRWVATPNTSSHVFGRAVDIGPSRAIAWLSRHGISYGLCQIYENEPWHYELRPQAIHDGCPPMYADPTHDPRMRQ